MKKNALFFVILFVSFTSYLQPSCKQYFSSGTKLEYLDDNKSYGTITVKDGYFIEYFNYPDDGMIKSKVEWLEDCVFKLTIVKVNGENMKFQRGQFITIIITQIEGNRAYYKYAGLNDDIERFYIKRTEGCVGL
jgi:hypothetical protein